MLQSLRASIGLWLLTTLFTGLLYPLAIWSVGKLFFPDSSSGGQQYFKEQSVGLYQIGQQWKDPAFFWGRPSHATIQNGWLISGNSSLSPASIKLYETVEARKQKLMNDTSSTLPPNDLLFASGSGLDPHIHRDTALYQIPRIVKARNLSKEQEEQLVQMVQELPSESLFEDTSTQPVHLLTLNIRLAEHFDTAPTRG